MKTSSLLALVILSSLSISGAQAEPPTVTYDLTTFKEKPKSKAALDFSLKADDFPKHSYKRALLKSQFATSSVGLGVNGQNQIYNPNAFDYLHPETLKDNLENVSDDDAYFDEAYNKPEVQKNYSNSYEVNKRFDDKFLQSDSKFQNKRDEELFGSPTRSQKNYSGQGNIDPSKKFQLNKYPNPDDSMF